jgi:NADH dehydrogenase
MSIPKVLILGGGYVTITAARNLRKAVERGEIELTVVTRENFHCFHGFVGEMLTGRVSVGSITSPVRRIFAPADIHMASVEHIDPSAQKVTVSRLHDGTTYELAYDHLLVAVGSADNMDMYPGLREHSHCLKTYDGCVKLKNHILQMFERASICSDPEERKALLTFVIAGGGYAGTEIAGEIKDYCRILTSKEYRHISYEDCRSILVCKTETILPELQSGKGAAGYGNGHPKLVDFAYKHTKKLGVEVLLNTKVEAASSTHVYLSNGSNIPTRTIVNMVGTKPQRIVEELDVPKDARGRILCNADMRAMGWNNIWGAGDCAAVPHPKGDHCPSVGIFALKTGKHFAKNVLRAVRQQPLKPFSYVGLGQGISIGKRTAVVALKGVPIKGLLAWILWRILLVYYFPTWDRRIRLIADWCMWLFVGRDIVEMGLKDEAPVRIKHRLYQPDECIASSADADHFTQRILSGAVKVISKGHIVGTMYEGEDLDLTPYSLYGEASAYAIGMVRTAAMKRSERELMEDTFTTPTQEAPVLARA